MKRDLDLCLDSFPLSSALPSPQWHHYSPDAHVRTLVPSPSIGNRSCPFLHAHHHLPPSPGPCVHLPAGLPGLSLNCSLLALHRSRVISKHRLEYMVPCLKPSAVFPLHPSVISSWRNKEMEGARSSPLGSGSDQD